MWYMNYKVLLLLMLLLFEGLHDNNIICNHRIIKTQRKLFKGNDWQGEREQNIVWSLLRLAPIIHEFPEYFGL